MARALDWSRVRGRSYRWSGDREDDAVVVPKRKRGEMCCGQCGRVTDAVTITHGLRSDGTFDVKVFCGNRCATKGGYAWAGLPSRFKGVTVHTVFQ